MPTVVLSSSRRRQLDVLPPGTLRSSGMSPDDARWAGSTEPEPVSVPRLDGPNGAESLDNLFIARGPQDTRQAALERESIKHAGDRQPTERAGRHNGHRFGGRVIDDRQALHHPSIGRAVEDEVGRPDLVRRLGAYQGLAVRHRDLLASPPTYLQPGLGIQALHPLVVDQCSRLPQLEVDHPGTVAAVLVRQGHDAGPQRGVGIRRRGVSQRRGTHAHQREHSPFAHPVRCD